MSGRGRGIRRAVLVCLVVGCVLGYVVVSLWPARSTDTSATARPIDAQPMTVLQVLSGDSLLLSAELPGAQVRERGTISVKLLSVDSPNYGIVPECFAPEAKGRLEELLPVGSIAWVATDAVAQDDAGRWLMNVWASDGRYVNYLLAVDGFVRAVEMPPNEALWQPVMRAGSSAAARFGGLWGECR
jgi:endonuclease YncB( thermonuclease family)